MVVVVVVVGVVVTFDLHMLTFDLPMLTFDLPMLTFGMRMHFSAERSKITQINGHHLPKKAVTIDLRRPFFCANKGFSCPPKVAINDSFAAKKTMKPRFQKLAACGFSKGVRKKKQAESFVKTSRRKRKSKEGLFKIQKIGNLGTAPILKKVLSE